MMVIVFSLSPFCPTIGFQVSSEAVSFAESVCALLQFHGLVSIENSDLQLLHCLT